MLLSGDQPKTFRLLPLSYRRLVEAKTIKLGSWDKLAISVFNQIKLQLARLIIKVALGSGSSMNVLL